VGTIALPESREKFLEVTDQNFADPLNFDFRVQATSEYRQPTEDSQYQGPYAFQGNVFYVKPDGDDAADGLSVTDAWRSLDHAFSKLPPDATLYLCDGTFSIRPHTVVRLKDVALRGRARGRAAIRGTLQLADCENLSVERIHFLDAPAISGGRNITLDNCVVAGKHSLNVSDTRGLRMTHSLLSVPIEIGASGDVFLSGNVYTACPAVDVDRAEAIVYSDYNAHANEAKVWTVAGKACSLADLRARGTDRYSQVVEPVFDPADNLAALEASISLGGRGPLGSAIGPYLEWKTIEITPIIGPFLYSVDHESANVEWWTTFPMEVEISWGETPDCANTASFAQQSYFSFSLTGLKPSTKYYVSIRPKRIYSNADSAYRVVMPENRSVSIDFTTPAAREHPPTTYFLSESGSDANDGKSRETAWRTLQRAADQIRPGDTVVLAGGTYSGGVYFRATGTKDKPITIKSNAGERVIIDGESKLHVGLILYGKHYYNLDALYLQRFPGIADNIAGTECGAVFIKGGSHLNLTRCHISLGWGPCIVAESCADLLMKNCVVMHSMTSTVFSRCRNLMIEHNVFIDPLIFHLRVGGEKAFPSDVRNNIFCENTRGKVRIAPITLLQSESNNCFFPRWPEEERLIYGHWTLPEYKARVRATDTFIGNPQFPGGTGWCQGWGPKVPNTDFHGLFACNPELVRRRIGLEPEAFRDFPFGEEPWPYTVAWAERILKQIAAADRLAGEGQSEQAMNAYLAIADQDIGEDRLKAELRRKAAMLADELGEYDRAMEIAKRIPCKLLAANCQMSILTAHEQYAAMIRKYVDDPAHGLPYLNWACPETEIPLGDFYYFRGMAYAKTGRLDEAETDLKLMFDKTQRLHYHPGTLILDIAAKRLGDFYRDYRKDDRRALDAYMRVVDRTTFSARLEPMPKPVLTGNYPVLVEATKAAAAILEKQEKHDKVREIRFSMLLAQAKASAALNRREEAIAAVRKALAIKPAARQQRTEAERLLDELESAGKQPSPLSLKAAKGS